MLQGQSNKNSILKSYFKRNLENSKSALEKLISPKIAAFESKVLNLQTLILFFRFLSSDLQ